MAEKTTTLRLRSVRFKSGGSISVLRPKTEVRDAFREATARIGSNEVADRMAGFAVVAWTDNGVVTVNFENSASSPVAGGGVAQYVKDILLTEQAVRWSRDD